MQFSYTTVLQNYRELAKDNGLSLAVFAQKKKSEVITLESGVKRIEIGCGTDPTKFDTEKFILAIREIVVLAKKHKIKKITLNMENVLYYSKAPKEKGIELVAINLILANYEFRECKSEPPKEGFDDVEDVLIFERGESLEKFIGAFERGVVIAEKKNEARTLCNMPSNLLTPADFYADVKRAFHLTSTGKIRVIHWDDKELKRDKFNGILAVGGGSQVRPCLISVEYLGGKKGEKPIVLIGKGVTFDSGGLSIKVDNGMKGMKMDMTGAAVVYKVIKLAHELGIKKNIIALMPMVENMLGRGCFRVGDIITIYGGKTLEIENTDAEGRVILVDTIAYAVKNLCPGMIIDVATLTGAASVAVGKIMSAIFTRDKALANLFCELGEQNGEYMWPLPLNDKFKKMVEGVNADYKNLGPTRYGGASTAAALLEHFVEDVPWIHIDIAPRMEPQDSENLAKGAVGEPVQTLVAYLRHLEDLDKKEILVASGPSEEIV